MSGFRVPSPETPFTAVTPAFLAIAMISLIWALLTFAAPEKFSADKFLVGPCPRTSRLRVPLPETPLVALTPAAVAISKISLILALGARSAALMVLLLPL